MTMQDKQDSYRLAHHMPTIQRVRHMRFVQRWVEVYGKTKGDLKYANDSIQQKEHWHLEIEGQKIFVDPIQDTGCCVLKMEVLDMSGRPGRMLGEADLHAYQLAGGWLIYDIKVMVDYLKKHHPWTDCTNSELAMTREEWHSQSTNAWLSDHWKHQPDSNIFNLFRFMYVEDAIIHGSGVFIEDEEEILTQGSG